MKPKNREARTDGLGVNESLIFNAPADKVWEMMLDVENYPRIFSTCDSIENLTPRKSLNPVDPGTRILDKRTVKGKKMEFVITATVIEGDDPNRRVIGWFTTYFQSTGTATNIVEPIDDQSCKVTCTLGMVPNGWYGRILLWFVKERLVRFTMDGLMLDLYDVKRVAETGKYFDKNSNLQPIKR